MKVYVLMKFQEYFGYDDTWEIEAIFLDEVAAEEALERLGTSYRIDVWPVKT